VVVAACSGGGGGSVTLTEYPKALQDAYCRYLARCGAFPDVATCERANLGLPMQVSPRMQAEIDMGKVVYDSDKAGQCIDDFGAQSCDTTDEDGRVEPQSCIDITHGTVGSGGACADNNECASKMCNVPVCQMACCQGTCVGDTKPAPGGPGTVCMSQTQCTAGTYCDITSGMCTALKAAGATCTGSDECTYGLACVGAQQTRTCKALPTVGQACPDGVCRDAGNYCNAMGMCAQIGLAGATCTSSQQCSSFYPCDQATGMCTQAPKTGEACTGRCFDVGTFCDTTAAMPTCVAIHADGDACTLSSQCVSDNCTLTGSGGTCTEMAVCI
jgi:hypothetical protein